MDNLILKMEKNFWVLSFAIFFFANCSQPQKQTGAEDDGIPTIVIMANISNAQKVTLSTVASSIDYCMLETERNCVLEPGRQIFGSGDCFVAMNSGMSSNYCYVFDRKTGNFVREISQIGQGPNDYQFPVKVLSGEKGQICLLGGNQYLFFNLDGTLSHKMNNPYLNHFNITAYEDLYVGYVSNRSGNSTIRLAFIDKTGELIDSIPNHRFVEVDGRRGRPLETDFSFHPFNNNLYYKDIYCDTLYHIKEFTLQPRYIFNTGGRAVPYKLQSEGRVDVREAVAGREWDRYAKYIVINTILEDVNFLYFTFDYKRMMYPAIYHKSEDKTQILMPESLPQHPSYRISSPYGFENDLDGGLPFWPAQMISEKEMMCVYTAEELLGLDVSKITDPKLKKVLNSIDEESNPVVAIVTLKE